MLSLNLIEAAKKASEPQADDELVKEIEALIAQRTEARANKDWAAADAIRDKLTAMNVAVKDSKDGISWEFIK